MKLSQNISTTHISDEFENGSGLLKNMATRWRASFPYMAIVKPCYNAKSHICGPMLMKLGQNICTYDIWAQIENGLGPFKTWPQGGVAFFLIWLFSNVNTRSRNNYPIFMKLDQNIYSNNSSAEFENG